MQWLRVLSMQISVDSEMLNKLLINLIDFSFQQENLILEIEKH